jgi:putative NIF3 family GTP cyclohydrolase 1 type 2
MLSSGPTRREFVAAAAGTLAAVRPASARQLTAGQLIERLQTRLAVPWNEKTLDGLKCGSAGTPVTGIAVTVMPTLEVLRRAAAAKRNFVLTHEPVFYAANEDAGRRENDPVYLAKKAFIDSERLVVYRLVEHWHTSQPHAAAHALASALGWSNERWTDDEPLFSVPTTRLSALAADVRKRLNTRGGVRVVGPAELPVRTVYVSPGPTVMPGVLGHIARADVVIGGEPREWEAVPYVADCLAAGQAKGLIALGRLVSEEPSAAAQAAWLRTFVGSLPVDHLPLGDPYWSPNA